MTLDKCLVHRANSDANREKKRYLANPTRECIFPLRIQPWATKLKRNTQSENLRYAPLTAQGHISVTRRMRCLLVFHEIVRIDFLDFKRVTTADANIEVNH